MEFTAFGVIVPAVLLGGYLALLRIRRISWPWWRVVCWSAGVAVLAWCVLGAPAAYRAQTPWWGALGIGLVAAVVPLGLALGDPVALWEAGRRQVPGVRGRVGRALMFPLVASTVSAVLLLAAFTSHWYADAQREEFPWDLLVLASLVCGLLVNLPLLSEDLLPSWCGPGLRSLFAFADGLLDAIPGIVVMTTVSKYSGAVLLGVAESVGVPMLMAVLVQWVRSDAAEAAAVDARLDAEEQAGVYDGTPWWQSPPGR
jgi:putative copper resistance protein D